MPLWRSRPSGTGPERGLIFRGPCVIQCGHHKTMKSPSFSVYAALFLARPVIALSCLQGAGCASHPSVAGPSPGPPQVGSPSPMRGVSATESPTGAAGGSAAAAVPTGPPDVVELRPLPLPAADPDFSSFVDPFIGTQGAGNVFPGPTLPFGLVKLGPDTTTQNANAGYTSDGDIVGFSHLHVSGTTGAPKYGVVTLLPTTGPLQISGNASPRAGESAAVGYYATRLSRYDIAAELSATRRAGFHRYVFPATKDAHILLDAGHVLTAALRAETQMCTGGAISAVSPTKIEGYGRYRGGWNLGREFKVFFCASTDTPAARLGTWRDTTVHAGGHNEPDKGTPVGAFWSYVTTAGQAIAVKVGISFMDSAAACASASSEIKSWDLGAVRRAAKEAWNEVLGHVVVDGVGAGEAEKKIFYTALYRAHLMPTDRSGENPAWKSKEPYYDDHVALWSTFRTLHPLLTLLQPDRESEIVRSMIDIYQHEDYLPDGRSGNDNGRTQGGSNGDIVLADAIVKKLPDLKATAVFDALIKDAETPPADPRKQGRGGLADYNLFGYVTTAYERAGIRTLEYSQDDWGIAQVARVLGRDGDFRRFVKRAGNWAHLWNPGLTADGIKGFIGPRNPDETWVPDFSVGQSGGMGSFLYESDSWQSSFDVPHDVRALMAKAGGAADFVRRLDTLFDKGHFRVGNPVAYFIPNLYIWAGRPDKTAQRVREIAARNFSAHPGGLPGSDAGGALSAWYAFAAMGFYPNAGSDHYLIAAPRFGRTVIRLGHGREFTIIAQDLSEGNRYVRGAQLGGKPLTQAWFRHADITGGNTLVLGMGARPSTWGANTPPPSMSDRP